MKNQGSSPPDVGDSMRTVALSVIVVAGLAVLVWKWGFAAPSDSGTAPNSSMSTPALPQPSSSSDPASPIAARPFAPEPVAPGISPESDVGVIVRGLVTDTEQRPIGAARVALEIDGRYRTARTDTDGRFKIERLPRFSHGILRVRAEGFQVGRREIDGRSLDDFHLTLAPARALNVSVRIEGLADSGTTVAALSLQHSGGVFHSEPVTLQAGIGTCTCEDPGEPTLTGILRFSGLPPVSVEAPVMEIESRRFLPLNFPGLPLARLLLRTAGGPFASQPVSTVRENGTVGVLMTDAQGQASLFYDRTAPTDATLSLWSAVGTSEPVDLSELARNPVTTITLGECRTRLVISGSTPDQRALADVRSLPSGAGGFFTTQSEDTLTFHVVPGLYSVTAPSSAARRLIALRVGEVHTVDLNVTLPLARVFGTSGQPGRLHLEPDGLDAEAGPHEVSFDGGGKAFEIPNVPLGAYALTALFNSGQVQKRRVLVTADTDLGSLDADVTPSGRIRILDHRGGAAASLSIRMQALPTGVAMPVNVSTDASGMLDVPFEAGADIALEIAALNFIGRAPPTGETKTLRLPDPDAAFEVQIADADAGFVARHALCPLGDWMMHQEVADAAGSRLRLQGDPLSHVLIVERDGGIGTLRCVHKDGGWTTAADREISRDALALDHGALAGRLFLKRVSGHDVAPLRIRSAWSAPSGPPGSLPSSCGSLFAVESQSPTLTIHEREIPP